MYYITASYMNVHNGLGDACFSLAAERCHSCRGYTASRGQLCQQTCSWGHITPATVGIVPGKHRAIWAISPPEKDTPKALELPLLQWIILNPSTARIVWLAVLLLHDRIARSCMANKVYTCDASEFTARAHHMS